MPLTFRVEINYVEVDAIVVDKRGRVRRRPPAGDFQVLEDGKPQAIKSFGLVRIPIERPEAPLFVTQPIEPDVQSNVRPFDGRVYLIVLDELHTTPLHTPWVRSAAKKFIETSMGANDVAAVVTHPGAGQPGLHRQQAAAPGRGGPVHGQLAAVGDAQQDRRSTTSSASSRAA